MILTVIFSPTGHETAGVLMTTHIDYQQGGFTVAGLSPWNENLNELAQSIGAHSIAWADTAQTSLFVSCESPEAVAFKLCAILRMHGVADWRQTVHIIDLDDTMAAFVFSHALPGGSVSEFYDHAGACDLLISNRTMVLMRDNQADDATWRAAIEAVWEILRKRDVPTENHGVPYYALPRAVGRGMVISLGGTLIAVRVHSTDALDVHLLKNRGVNLAYASKKVVLLGAGERPAPIGGQPHRIERPTPFEFAAGLARSMHILFTTRNCLGFNPQPVEIII